MANKGPYEHTARTPSGGSKLHAGHHPPPWKFRRREAVVYHDHALLGRFQYRGVDHICAFNRLVHGFIGKTSFWTRVSRTVHRFRAGRHPGSCIRSAPNLLSELVDQLGGHAQDIGGNIVLILPCKVRAGAPANARYAHASGHPTGDIEAHPDGLVLRGLVNESSRAWVGCSPIPSPALMTGLRAALAAMAAEPTSGWRMTITSA